MNVDSLSVPELDNLLRRELWKRWTDEDLVRRILSELQSREADQTPSYPPDLPAAVERFVKQGLKKGAASAAKSWAILVTTAATAACLLMSMGPVEAKADSWWDKLERWKESVVEYFSPTDAKADHADYVFQTENQGLQDVYDAVTELGITDPVVPMWLPEGYELIENVVTSTATKSGIYAVFSNGECDAILKVSVHNTGTWYEYQKDEANVTEYEKGEVKHFLMRNVDKWVVIWATEKLECVLSINCQENELYNVIDSIYILEVE